MWSWDFSHIYTNYSGYSHKKIDTNKWRHHAQSEFRHFTDMSEIFDVKNFSNFVCESGLSKCVYMPNFMSTAPREHGCRATYGKFPCTALAGNCYNSGHTVDESTKFGTFTHPDKRRFCANFGVYTMHASYLTRDMWFWATATSLMTSSPQNFLGPTSFCPGNYPYQIWWSWHPCIMSFSTLLFMQNMHCTAGLDLEKIFETFFCL